MTESDESRFGEVERGTLRYGADGMLTVWGARDILLSMTVYARRDASRADDIALSALFGRLNTAMDDFEDAVVRAHAVDGCTGRGPNGADRYVCADCRDADPGTPDPRSEVKASAVTDSDESCEEDTWLRDAAARRRGVPMTTCSDDIVNGVQTRPDGEVVIGHVEVPVFVRLADLADAMLDTRTGARTGAPDGREEERR